MRPPSFWSAGTATLPAMALLPASLLVSAIAARRARTEGMRAGVPVLCCGNATVGGAGKTTLALDLLGRLAARGLRPHALTRGHGGRVTRPRRVHAVDADLYGDEALLLARIAPTWVGADRAASAREAVAAGATALVMDDGLQNFGLHKDASFLVVDGGGGFGNGLVLPAGPLREPPVQAVRRCRAIVLVGEDRTDAVRHLRGSRPVLHARLRQGPEIERLRCHRVIAFAGIGRPGKFFDGLTEAGLTLADRIVFPDHHRFRPRDLQRLAALRDRVGPDAVLATTPKDAVRLPRPFRDMVVEIGVHLAWDDDRIERIIDAVLTGQAAP